MGAILAAGTTKSGGGSYFFLIVIVGVLALMYFVTIRPQRARQRRVQQTQGELVPGLQVRTTAGIYGKITSTSDTDVTLEVAPGVEIRILRRAIMEVLSGDGRTGFGTGPTGTASAADDGGAAGPAGGDEDAGPAGGTGARGPLASDGSSPAATARNETDVTAVDGKDTAGDPSAPRATPAE